MNWVQYFNLLDKRRKWFWNLLFAMVLINLLFFRSSFLDSRNSFCNRIGTECNFLEYNRLFLRNNSMPALASLDSEAQINKTENLTALVSGPGDSFSMNQDVSLWGRIKRYVVTDCGFECVWDEEESFYARYLVKASIIANRMLHTPFLIITNIIAAFLFSYALYLYQEHKLENVLIKKEGEEENEGKENKKKDK
jgi:hypothetical protein